jgi:hypothetical protein
MLNTSETVGHGRTKGGRLSGRWADLREAAEILGLSTEAVRKRASRGSIRSERHDGRVVVWVDDDRTGAGHDDGLVDELRRQNEYLRSQLDIRTDELREHRRLLAGLIERVPELEAPDRARDGHESVPEDAGGGAVPEEPQKGSERPWWRRVFGG